MTASLENRRSYVPRTGVYEETRRLTSSKKRKKKLNCSVKCAGQFKPKALGLYFSYKQMMFRISQLQVLEPVLNPDLHSDELYFLSHPSIPDILRASFPEL